MPLASINFPEAQAREAATQSLYLDELGRQARLANDGIAHALTLGQTTPDTRDPSVWAALQSALFASIVVARLLKPITKCKYPGMTYSQTKQYAENRGTALMSLLDIDPSSPLFSVFNVRNAFEHYDEKLDSHIVSDIACLSDWYISDGIALATPADSTNPARAVGLRVFYPGGGLLIFDSTMLDLFALDVALLDLRVQVRDKREELRQRIRGRALYGGHVVVRLLPPDRADSRHAEWQAVRTAAEADLASTEPSRPDTGTVSPQTTDQPD
ncbi:hypothetical protein Pen02_00360 [Plantactinospora endophytica]|uniref:Uncharacterized protein n=1 Tax=Plantactinospora endophytica TaxID=673535 RepID=A0ABQ4DRN0_9ACTN|nr:hypothetical protein Pen02_00360 [Plantactinospora endophytica]